MSIAEERAEILDWLYWAEGMTAGADRDLFPARRLIRALQAIEEGRSDALLIPAKKSNSSKPEVDQEAEALAVASVDALIKIGVPLSKAMEKVRAIAGPTITIDLRKKITSGKSEKYKGHRKKYLQCRERITLGLIDRGPGQVSERIIIDNLALAVLMSKGTLPR